MSSVTLIPRGPLICSNLENFDNWLPERLYVTAAKQNSRSDTTSLNTATESVETTSTLVTESSNAIAYFDSKEPAAKPPRLTISQPSPLSPITLSKTTTTPAATNLSKLSLAPSSASSPLASFTAKPAPVPLVPAAIYPQFIKLEQLREAKKLLPIISHINQHNQLHHHHRNRVQSDCDFNFQAVTATSEVADHIYSSNDEDNEVFIKLKLKEAEMVRFVTQFLL